MSLRTAPLLLLGTLASACIDSQDAESTPDTAGRADTADSGDSGDSGVPDKPASAVQGELETTNSIGRSGSYHLPAGYNLVSSPMMVAYHGTGGNGASMLSMFGVLAVEQGFMIVAPDSRVSPTGDNTWEVGTKPGEITEDYTHSLDCMEELLAMEGVSLDERRVLAVGFSGGGSSAPYVATNEPVFTAFAVLHGGVYAGGLSENIIPGWFSTGEDDEARTPEHVEEQAQAMIEAGFEDIEFHVYPGGHSVFEEEKADVVGWWMGL